MSRTRRWARRPLALVAIVVLLLLALPGGAVPVAAQAGSVVVSQVYGGGGNSGATLKNDFIELFNSGTAAVDLTGWTVQYASSGGTSWQKTALSGVLQPGQYYLVQEAAGAGGTVALPTPDATGSIAMSSSAGKVALVRNATLLTGSCPLGGAVEDFVGFGAAANCSEGGTPTATLSNTTAVLRASDGCTDTNNNGADFGTPRAPAPRNSASPLHPCPDDQAPTVSVSLPATDVSVDASIPLVFSEPVAVTGTWFSLSCSVSGAHETVAVSGGQVNFTLDPTANFSPNETCTLAVFAAGVTDLDTSDPPDNMAADFIFLFATVAPAAQIHDIQGAGHISPMAGQRVSGVSGVVTGIKGNGFFIQGTEPDANPATSEGIFVFTSSAPSGVRVGDLVAVSATVQEYRAGGSSADGLTITELSSPQFAVRSSGNALPVPAVIGRGGRVPPAAIIEDDAAGNVETTGTFDPDQDGIDFWESLEAMLVQVNDAVAAGPTNSYGEIVVLADGGADAGPRTGRGGILARPDDFNPERIMLVDDIVPTPAVNVGDRFAGPLVGVLDYSFNNYKIAVTTTPVPAAGGIAREVGPAAGLTELSVATVNVENLDPGDGAARFAQMAGVIVQALQSPDIVALEEIQDNNGAANDGTVDAATTFAMLIEAIQAAGGPVYQYRQINPVNNQDGGEGGGNIRVGFLFRTDRGLTFLDRPGGTATTGTTFADGHLTYSPGRVDPGNAAFANSRKPLAGEFNWRGHQLFVIANHFNSKGGDQPLFGRYQPPVRSSEVQRRAQAQVLHDFVASILSSNPDANVILAGDFNDFEFSEALGVLRGTLLFDPIEQLPLGERYSYVYDGNSQALDHIMLSRNLFAARPYRYDIVHINAEFAVQLSDHDPQLVLLALDEQPVISAGGPYTVAEGGTVKVAAVATDPEGGLLDVSWDLDGDGLFESAGNEAVFHAEAIDGPTTRAISAKAVDATGQVAVVTASVTVENAVPAVAGPSAVTSPVQAGTVAEVGATFTDAGIADTHTAVWSWGDGTTSPGIVEESGGNGSVAGSHTYATPGIYSVNLTVADDDGGSAQSIAMSFVVYGPDSGSLTGGGWFGEKDSKVTFAVSAKYGKDGATLDGKLELQLHGDVGNVRSTSLDWLVITGTRAYLQGSATLDGKGDYGFRLVVAEGQGKPALRVRVWEKATGAVVYDSQPGSAPDAEPTVEPGGGDLTIHLK